MGKLVHGLLFIIAASSVESQHLPKMNANDMLHDNHLISSDMTDGLQKQKPKYTEYQNSRCHTDKVKKGRMVKNIRCIPTKSITMKKMIAKINVLLTINARASNLRRRRVVRYGIKNRRNREPIKKKMLTVTGKNNRINIKSTKIV